MAGHSKWNNIKGKKMKEDNRRAQIFTKIARQIMVAAKEGGPDPESNFKLRLAVESARTVNMPNDNIERAISRGVGGQDDSNYEEVIYEGYGPNGVAILLEALTDNRNRTAGELRHRFSKNGGNLGESGCVAWMFDKKGLLVVELTDDLDVDQVMLDALEAGAEDVLIEEETIQILTDPAQFQTVKGILDSKYVFLGAEISMVPQNFVDLSDEEGERVEKLVEALEDIDDIQQVYSNLA